MFLTACVTGLEPDWPRLQPRPEWEAEYRWTWATCGQLARGTPRTAYRAIRWQMVPNSGDRFWLEGEWVHASYHPGSNTIVVSEMVAGESMMASWMRRHEFLHAVAMVPDGADLFAWCERAFVLEWMIRG
jgi:hypothetical protein